MFKRKYKIKILTVAISLLLFISIANIIAASQNRSLLKTLKNENFTHAVFVEFGTATNCHYCKFAHRALKNLYESKELPFYYVSLVDENENAYVREKKDYNISGYPTVYFDGGNELVVGSTGSIPSDIDKYNLSITNSVTRHVQDIDAMLSAEWLGDANIEINVSIYNKETKPYDGYLRVYVTEKISTMGWYDTFGDPYTFAFLDYAFNESIYIDEGEMWIGTTTWNGFDHNDGYGNNFGSISKDNIMIIAAVFNNTSHQGYSNPPDGNPFDAYYVDETTALDLNESSPAKFQIDNIKIGFAGFGKGSFISADIKNIGECNAIDFKWSLKVKGGIFKGIDIFKQGSIDALDVGKTVTIDTNSSIFGLGKIEVTISIGIYSKKSTGFVFGPFILLI
jgi:glutaredoxin